MSSVIASTVYLLPIAIGAFAGRSFSAIGTPAVAVGGSESAAFRSSFAVFQQRTFATAAPRFAR